MRPVTYVLLTVLVLLIAGKVYFTALRRRVCFRRVRSESLPEGFLKTVCPQPAEVGFTTPDGETPEVLSGGVDLFQVIAENADPESPNQAVLYVEDSDIVLVSAAIVARIARGDRWLARRVMRWTAEFENASVIVANFGFFEYGG